MNKKILKLKVDNKDKNLKNILRPQWSWKTLISIVFLIVFIFVVNDLRD